MPSVPSPRGARSARSLQATLIVLTLVIGVVVTGAGVAFAGLSARGATAETTTVSAPSGIAAVAPARGSTTSIVAIEAAAPAHSSVIAHSSGGTIPVLDGAGRFVPLGLLGAVLAILAVVAVIARRQATRATGSGFTHRHPA